LNAEYNIGKLLLQAIVTFGIFSFIGPYQNGGSRHKQSYLIIWQKKNVWD